MKSQDAILSPRINLKVSISNIDQSQSRRVSKDATIDDILLNTSGVMKDYPASPSSTMGNKGGKTGFDIQLREMERIAGEEAALKADQQNK